MSKIDKMPTYKTKKLSKKKLLVGVLVVTMMVGTVSMTNEYKHFSYFSIF
ncbi:MAG: hypothetical protein ACRC92_24880 [Peptostreptococcaceae bacterium]